MRTEAERFQVYESQISDLIDSFEALDVVYHKRLVIAGSTFELSGNSTKFEDLVEPSFKNSFLSFEPNGQSDFRILLIEGKVDGQFPKKLWEDIFPDQQVNNPDSPQLFLTDRFRICFLSNLGILFGVDFERRRMIYWTDNLITLALTEFSSPLRLNFVWWANSVGLQMLHAGCVGGNNGAVLIIGPSGKGKSTLSVSAAVVGGLDFIGDDSVIASLNDGPGVHSIYSSAKLDRAALEKFPELVSSMGKEVTRRKHLLDLSLVNQIRLPRSLPLSAAIVPEFGISKACELTEISPDTARLQLVPSTSVYSLGVERESFHYSNRLITLLPCFSYSYDDPRSAGKQLKGKLEQMGIEI